MKSWLVVICAAMALSAIALAYGYAQWQPTMEEVRSYKKYRDDLILEEKKKDLAIKRVQKAEQMAREQVQIWNAIAAKHTLPPTLAAGGIDLTLNGWQLLTVMPDFRNSLQKQVNAQVKAGGVRVIAGPTIPPPPDDPNAILSTYFFHPGLPPVVIFDLGTITVEGTYKQITDNMKAWSAMPHFLAVADGLRLQGTSPKLTGTYSASIVGFVQVPPGKSIFPPVPEGGRLIATTPTAGGPGGPAAGGPGKPPVPGAGAAKAPVPGRGGKR
jgi:hypothetical protein